MKFADVIEKIDERSSVPFMEKVYGWRSVELFDYIYSQAKLCVEDFKAGSWEFYTFKDDLDMVFVSLPTNKTYILSNKNGFKKEVNGLVAGLALTMTSLNHLSFDYDDDLLIKKYIQLKRKVLEEVFDEDVAVDVYNFLD